MNERIFRKVLRAITHVQRWGISSWVVGTTVILLLISSGCESERPPIRIGFSGGLTGRYSDLGVSGRNGVQLAVEEINSSGGINGRRVELLVRDDRQDPKTAVLVDQELIREGVVAIIGHMTSAMSMAVMPLINQERMLLISPTTSSSELSGMDDWFFRVAGTNDKLAMDLAEHIIEHTPIRRMSVMFDFSNRSYTETFIKVFRTRYTELGGKLTLVASFFGGNDPLRNSIGQTLLEPACEGVLVLACALDAAWICQQIRRQNAAIGLFTTGWPMTREFLEHGGRSVEGVRFIDYFNWNSRQPGFHRFNNAYQQRFGSVPSFSAIYAYEAAQVLFQALSQNPDPKALKKTIVDIRRFSGLFEDFDIDAFGDAHRRSYMITVENNRFVVME